MSQEMVTGWVCPVCEMSLRGASGVVACMSGHSYDRAKEGYIYLLGGSRQPRIMGDSVAMLAARRRFFDAGFYEPLRRRLIEIVRQMNTKVVVELGCGEGYYIGGLSEQIISSKCLATDLAKAAVKQAANRYKKVEFAVADTNQKLPLADASVDVILDIFAPRNTSEFARILKPEGRVLVVTAGEHHMEQLRTILPLAIQADKRAAVERTMGSAFRLVSAQSLTIPMELARAELEDLIVMTPNARFLEDGENLRLAQLPVGEVTAEFQILLFSRVGTRA